MNPLSFFESVWQDLRAKRLWPVAAGLLMAIVAVPVVLGSSSSTPAPAAPSLPSPSTVAAIPAVNETSTPSSRPVKGSARDPFAPAAGSGSAPSTPTSVSALPGTSVATQSGSGTTTTTTTSSGGSPSSGASSTGSGFTGTPSPLPKTIHTGKPTPTTHALGSRQAYAVKLAITNPSGGLDTIDSLPRLSVLPSPGLPLLVELGVLRGGKRVLFAVRPGTIVSGPGSCVPGPIDCQILSLGQDQTETLGVQSARGPVPVALFAVTGLTVRNYASKSAAQRAREAESAAGRRVLNHSSLTALSLFRYEGSIGAVVDLRNLIVGSS